MRFIAAFLFLCVPLFADERPGRVLFFHASCPPCIEALEGPQQFPDWLRKAGWKIGVGTDSHVQLIDVDRRDDLRTIYKVDKVPSMVVLGSDLRVHKYTDRQSLLSLLPSDSKPEASPTPYAEVVRVLSLLPKPEVGFVDYGCGDARWCIAAAEKWGCKATGIEIDPTRAAMAKRRVQDAGLGHLVTIIEGDATTTDVAADVGVAYLYQGTLDKLKPRAEKLRAFASYIHQPAGMQVTKNGDSWIYTRHDPVKAAVWNGQSYAGPVCNNPSCGMCNSIRAQLAAPVSEKPATAGGHYEMRKFCNGRSCWFENVWVPDVTSQRAETPPVAQATMAAVPSQQSARSAAVKKTVYVVSSTTDTLSQWFLERNGYGTDEIKYRYAYVDLPRVNSIDHETWKILLMHKNSGRFKYPFFVMQMDEGDWMAQQAKVD